MKSVFITLSVFGRHELNCAYVNSSVLSLSPYTFM